MICQATLLAESQDGKIFFCTSCASCITLLFGNICQCFEMADYKVFADDLINLDVEAYFHTYKYESKIYINSKIKSLYYSFSREEIVELQELLLSAHIKIELVANVFKNLN